MRGGDGGAGEGQRAARFLTVNLGMLGVQAASVLGLRSGHQAAWFLAVAGIVNGIAHPLFAIVTGGHFPGLVTSPVIGGAGLLLWIRLYEATGRELVV